MNININGFCNISKLNAFLTLFCLQKCLFNLFVTFFFLVKSKFWKKYYLTCYTLAKKKYPGLDFIQEDICLLKLIIAQH